jgi:hypothetical protein
MFERNSIGTWFWGIPCGIVAVYAINYFIHFGSKWDENVVSLPTFLIEIVKILIFFVGGIVGIIFFIFLIGVFIQSLPSIYLAIKELPERMKHEAALIRRIWDNRGFSKYSLFGGIDFYLRLRLRIVAYMLACTFFVSTGYFTYEKYRTYEPTHWVEKVYHHSKPKIYKFKKNVPYTICVHGSKVEYIFVNGYHFCDTKSPYSSEPNAVPVVGFKPHNTFNVTFPSETNFAVLLHTEMVINDIVSRTLEIWENKKEGIEYSYTIFDPYKYYNNEESPPSTNNSKKKKKKKK